LKNFNKIKFSLNFITNFKPNKINFNNNNNLIFNNKNKDKICNNNFFLFMNSMKFFQQQNNFKKSSIFIKKYKRKVLTILRAPYRHKLSRHQLVLERFFIVQQLEYKLKSDIYIHKNTELLKLLKTFKKLYSYFETNLVYQHKMNLFINFFYKNNFILNNFIK
jgi:hypothetical protein